MITFVLILVLCLCVVCIYNIWNNHYVYSQFKAFNNNIKQWSISIDEEMRDAINRQAMQILSEMDDKITEFNNNNLKNENEND